MENGKLLRSQWLLQENMHVAVCIGLVKTCKKKFNEIKNFKKTPQLRVGINGVDTKTVKFIEARLLLNIEVIF